MRKYCGCVTDQQFNLALLELYPNRKPHHLDAWKRKKIASECRDLPELAIESNKHEARRYYKS